MSAQWGKCIQAILRPEQWLVLMNQARGADMRGNGSLLPRRFVSYWSFAIALAGVFVAGSAFGQIPVDSPAPIWWGTAHERPKVPVVRWYGWQTLIGVVAADVVTIPSALNMTPNDFKNGLLPSEGAIIGLSLGISAHTLAGPIVHWAHGHVGRGFAVLGLNLTLVATGFFIAPFLDAEAPAVIGYVAGPLLDMALFSYEIVKEPLPRTAMNSAPLGVTFGIAPIVDSTRRGLLLTGQF